VVDDPVTLNGVVAIPRGASATLQAVAVKQSGTMKGSDKISLKVHSIAFGGNVYEVSTGYVESKGKGEGKKNGRKVGGGAGLGGIIGGIAGGGEGAAIGAVVGGLTGAAVASGGEEHLKIDAETRLQFQLAASVSIRQ
jgi:outer membrane lipoprotein SlyB